ncbi:MotA/TolQ/ExbB proton channel family protein [Salidesulfovibrio brasiliensis]|uniref:MotA/TolQ/ExbB proton channel family protein n=1 Tax=Salidesulfovibrio brasiliensis TaxID=221711 RepID=UPI0006CFE3DF|nr:MotA/TolQ/ExbB proton channel family protein [Salidesulfovibrio brasiliensis]
MTPDIQALTGRIFHTLDQGGTVLVALFVLSIVMWSLILFKAWQLAAMRRAELPAGQLIQALRQNILPANWQGELIRTYLKACTGQFEVDKTLLHRQVHKASDLADTHIRSILVLAGLAPLLGLIGTVSGMIDAFDTITVWGNGNPKLLSSGISQALLTTQAGLLVAIPGLFLGHFLKRRAETLKDRTHRTFSRLSRTFDSMTTKGIHP